MAGNILNNLGSLPVVFASGHGSTLIDTDGKNYIDFVSGIGVNCLGHGHPALVEAISNQASRQIHISNYYNSDTGLSFSKALLERTGMDKVFFCNSGAEANEAAIKIARKMGAARRAQCGGKASEASVIVTLNKSFHGRTITTLSATGQDKFHSPAFAPYTPGFVHIDANDWDALERTFTSSICAFMFECVQGEGGVNLIDAQWIQAACAAAKKAGALIIADEVQTGVGRTGTYLACESLGIEADVVTLAKGIAGGVPMGAALARGAAADILVAGDHQSTFGGNPLAAAAGLVVLQELSKPGFLSAVTANGQYMRDVVASWNLSCIKDVRGKGLMIGIDVSGTEKGPLSAAEIQSACLKAGLCISTAGSQTLRFLPPLVISKEDIDKGLSILKTVLAS